MSLKVYNVLSGKKEEFKAIEPGKVRMYGCGITVSDNAHIGHAYQAAIFDMIRKYLEYIGYEVTYVRNYTDVDDKIIINARNKGVNPLEYAQKYIDKTDRELDALNIARPTIASRATECIEDIIEFIDKLIEKGHAYATPEGNVYFKVASFNKYGEFSHRDIEEQLSGVRKDIEPGKEDSRDFALWKTAGNDEIYWDSPWGKGRPGWHIECSAMSIKYLGETLDIHGGGRDLRFPHHENEIAQSEALTEKKFANYWIHNGLIKINGQKMSKSLGNGILIEELIEKYNPDVVKMTLLQNNYRTDINIVDGMFEQNEKNIYTFYNLLNNVNSLCENVAPDLDSEEYMMVKNNFVQSMDNDFNTAGALSHLFNYFKMISKWIDVKEVQKLANIKAGIIDTYKVLGMFEQEPEKVINGIKIKYLNIIGKSENEINDLISKRNELKAEKKYEEADNIRKQLEESGITIKDTKEGTNWDIKFSVK